MRITLDIESNNLLNDSSLAYPEFKLKDSYKVHCIVCQDIDTKKIYKFYKDSLQEIKGFLENVTMLIGHNIIDFDLPVLKLYFGIDYEIYPDKLLGHECEFIDTLVLSKLMNPDRSGGHSLKSWGKRLGFAKGDFGEVEDDEQDIWVEFSEDMLEYCVRDVELTTKVYEYLLKQEGFGREPCWREPFELEKAVREIVSRQQHVGFWFNKEAAERHHTTLVDMMNKIEKEVEPQLPSKPITKTAAKGYIAPVRQFKKDGTAAADLFKFAEKHGGVLEVDEKGAPKKLSLPFGEWTEFPIQRDEPLLKEVPMHLADQKFIKQHLVELGWVPTEWGERDLTLDSKKRKQSKEKIIASIERYIEDCKENPFLPFRMEDWEAKNLEDFSNKLMSSPFNRAIKVKTSPKFTVGLEKDIDPALENVSGADYGQDIADWLTYRHRKNAIKSEKGTGFLNTLRSDGRINTPADTLGAVTSRFKHRNVANIPRVTSKFGAEMRELFGVDEEHLQVGCDADGLEARIEGHYTYKYQGGAEYAEALVAAKPNDIHTVNAKKMKVPRDSAKSVKYGLSYGANWPKLMKMLGVDEKEAKRVFNSFWEAAKPLADLKAKATHFWENAGNRAFIPAIDGRRLWVRSPHAILNTIFQSAGVICMKRAMVIWDRWIKEKGIENAYQMIAYHDETQAQVLRNMADIRFFKTEEEAEEYKEASEKETGKMFSDVGHAGKWFWCGYCEVGELLAKSITAAGEYYNLNVSLTGGYQLGRHWGECH